MALDRFPYHLPEQGLVANYVFMTETSMAGVGGSSSQVLSSAGTVSVGFSATREACHRMSAL